MRILFMGFHLEADGQDGYTERKDVHK